MTVLFIVAALVWFSVIVYAAPAVWQTIAGKEVRRGDPMRLGVFLTATVIVVGCLRYLIAPSSTAAVAAIFVLLIADGIFILRLMVAYGRGDAL